MFWGIVLEYAWHWQSSKRRGCRVGNSKALSGRSVNTDAEQSWLCMPHGHTRWWSTSFRGFSISAKMSLADSKQISRKCLCTSLIRNTNSNVFSPFWRIIDFGIEMGTKNTVEIQYSGPKIRKQCCILFPERFWWGWRRKCARGITLRAYEKIVLKNVIIIIITILIII